MSDRIHNFNVGPAALPLPYLVTMRQVELGELAATLESFGKKKYIPCKRYFKKYGKKYLQFPL